MGLCRLACPPWGAGWAQPGPGSTQNESAAPLRMVYDPKSPVANKDGYVAMSNVDVVEEMTNMISASRAYQTNVEMLNTAKTMLQKTLTIGQ